MQGETTPKEENHVRLSKELKDKWGVPQLITSVDYDENDEKILRDFHGQATEMLEKAGGQNIRMADIKQNLGLDIHEMDSARMGHDPKRSILNE